MQTLKIQTDPNGHVVLTLDGKILPGVQYISFTTGSEIDRDLHAIVEFSNVEIDICLEGHLVQASFETDPLRSNYHEQ